MSKQRLTPADLETIAARAEAATSPPWQYDGQHDEITAPKSDESYWLIVSEGHTAGIEGAEDEFGHQFNPNLAFCAAARDDVPALLAELAAVTVERDEARAQVREAVALDVSKGDAIIDGLAAEYETNLAALRQRAEYAEGALRAVDENQRRQLESLGLLERFAPGTHVANDLGEALLNAEAALAAERESRCANCGKRASKAERCIPSGDECEWFCSDECASQHDALGCPFERGEYYRHPIETRQLLTAKEASDAD
jgi:hypothetical protein